MLDSVTRKRIDNCRDILVGKLPSPSAQVEQITIALIYKFMDDMDRVTVEEYGGNPTFFEGDFEKYSWQNIYSPRTDAHQMLNLYAEGIQKMGQNPGLNPMFRSIFKDAFLPYRDPETLRLFLSTINEFSYEHSEMLGDAFEYLLSIMGSQGEAGQFRTPRHIIDFLVELVDPKIGETILDPACGTSGFLISAYKHILNSNKKNKPGDLLSSSQKKELLESINGYDISPDMVRLSSANLFLHGFTDDELNIHEYDTLSSEDRWSEYYDVIIANPPFMTPKGGIRPHNRFSVDSNRAEVLFTNYIMEHLTPKGRAGIVVPEGIIFQTGKAYKQLRKALVEKYLIGVISLPSGVFNPYSGVKTSILILDKELSQRTDRIFFGKVENDGYDLGAQRREINKNDLPKIKEGVLGYIQNLTNDINKEHPSLSYVSKDEILNSSDLGLSFERYSSIEINSNLEGQFLKEFIDLTRGITYKKNQEIENSNIKVLRANNINLDTYKLDFNDIKNVSEEVKTNENQKIKKGDIVICLASGSNKHIGKVALVDEDFGYYVGGFMGIIRTNAYVLPKYLFYNLTNKRFNDYLNRVLNSTSINNLSKKILDDFKIPIPSLEIQKEIVQELKQYQKVIDGAKQVVDNYRPHIDTSTFLKFCDLGTICDFKRGPFGGALKKEIFVKEGFLVYEQYHAINNDPNWGRYYITEEKYNEMEAFWVEENDLLVSCSGTMGRITKIPSSYSKGIINQALLRLRNKTNSGYNTDFLKYYLSSKAIQQRYFQNQMGSGIPNVRPVKELKKIQVPILDYDYQLKIVNEINEQLNIVEGNKKLIEIYTQKIEDRINKIWGE